MTTTLPKPRTVDARLARALSYAGGSHSVEDVVQACDEGRMQLWQGPKSRIVTQVVEHPQKRVLEFFLAWGNVQEIERMTPHILAWGKTEMGCTSAAFLGRKGWSRSFAATSGWQVQPMVYMTKEL